MSSHLLVDTKIQTLQQFLDDTDTYPAPIVFTNGCFDLLHAGHVNLLRRAKNHGKTLVVGLNSDASIRGLKGATRPITSLEQRAYVLSGLECVDVIITFEEDTPLNLILAIRPHVLIKGGDWPKDRIVGASEVEAWGGQVLSLELLPGYSTTSIVERILHQAARTAFP
ncbi:rfaE bifunctional protein, domain II [Desulfonatronum thiosulfatophilum]|uniref:D-glycero-beta-D-manno-heptose 1-phosphate adenylyltransferase n=1 Tax=Desulfonatronum thiosulfatophilum TaxID=617002 RepID=A0A1G6C2K6_9BACT|nr:D-glycero-beta-D-manno-heptose 1-phosphate adenylyltransferase [Desulfonatronum thiosulfatophilum]SDB27026.1 rfaE bifunctional protein, domain II [Desulfonatronum thiosulfatophilum]